MKEPTQAQLVWEGIVVACACELMTYNNPYDRGAPAAKAWRELSSAVKRMKRAAVERTDER